MSGARDVRLCEAMLDERLNLFIDLLRRDRLGVEDLQLAAYDLFGELKRASGESLAEAMARIAPLVNLDDNQRAGWAAIVCGALVERGQDARLLTPLLMPRVRALLASRNAAALEPFWRPTIAVLSDDAETRRDARDLRTSAKAMAHESEGAHWIEHMLSVLDDEPVLVIEPSAGVGFAGRISGIADNLQLNTLLMDVFPGASTPRVPKAVVEIVNGSGPQQGDYVVKGCWNLCTWRAVQPGLVLPVAEGQSTGDWIWNEGKPEDIPLFDGRRVVLLGPSSYERIWPAQRTFSRLEAKVEIERELGGDETRSALSAMLAAKS